MRLHRFRLCGLALCLSRFTLRLVGRSFGVSYLGMMILEGEVSHGKHLGHIRLVLQLGKDYALISKPCILEYLQLNFC